MKNENSTPENDKIRVIEKFIFEENYYNELIHESSSTDRYEKVNLSSVSVSGIKGYEAYDLKLNFKLPWGYDIIDEQFNKNLSNPNLTKMSIHIDWVDQDGENCSNTISRGFTLDNSPDNLKPKKILLEDLIKKSFKQINKLSEGWFINSYFSIYISDEIGKDSKAFVVELEKGEVEKAPIGSYMDELNIVASMIATDFYLPYYGL